MKLKIEIKLAKQIYLQWKLWDKKDGKITTKNEEKLQGKNNAKL